MDNVIIIGKNSFIYNIIKKKLNKKIIAISHDEPFKKCSGKIVFLFSVDKKSYRNNDIILNRLVKSKPKKIVLISSLSCLVANENHYKYPKIKLSQELYLKSNFDSYSIIRLSTPIESNTSNRIPSCLYFSNSLIDYINNSDKLSNKKLIHIVDEIHLNKSSFYVKIYSSIIKIMGSRITRLFDLIFKYFSNYNYGYAFLSVFKYHEKYSRKH